MQFIIDIISFLIILPIYNIYFTYFGIWMVIGYVKASDCGTFYIIFQGYKQIYALKLLYVVMMNIGLVSKNHDNHK
jgi:hypothetical protein